MKASEAINELTPSAHYPAHAMRLEIAALIEAQQKVVDAAIELMEDEQSKGLRFHYLSNSLAELEAQNETK